jgi:LmbE family N-acetylglucosaminyl deacetylase
MAKKNLLEKIDVLFIGAHQDDVDAIVGGTVILLTDKGYKVEILDLSKRKGMFFSEEEKRGKEAENAAKIMKVKRHVIDLGLLKIKNTYENRIKIANFIRKKRPEIVVTLADDKHHPDHHEAHQLILDALHYSFASAIKTKFPPWRVKKIYFYPPDLIYEFPSGKNLLFVDISSTFKRKMEALKCYASQVLFHPYNQKYVLEYIEALNKALGRLIRRDYAEILMTDLPILDPFPELKPELKK